jgi:hypothetical protein
MKREVEQETRAMIMAKYALFSFCEAEKCFCSAENVFEIAVEAQKKSRKCWKIFVFDKNGIGKSI